MVKETLVKKLMAILIVLLFLGTATLVLAIEISYPQIPGVEAPQDFWPKIQSGQYPGEQALPLLAKYFYALGLVAGTMLTVISLIYGGVLYILSGSNPGKMLGAKDQIATAFLGLGLLLMSYLFLNILNPDLLIMRLPVVTRPSFSPPPNIELPEERALAFWEIPLGTITNDIANIYPGVKPASQDVEDKADIAKQASQELVSLLSSCNCQNLSPQCSASGCSPLACTGTRNNLCPNLTTIETKKQDLLNKLGVLKVSRKNLAIVKFNLQKETSRLQVAETLMKSCNYVPIDLNTLLGLKQTSKIEVKKPWSETEAKNNPLTFYCQVDEAFVTQTIFQWRDMIAQLESILNTDPDDIPLPPPSPGPSPSPGGTPGPSPSPTPGFSFISPLGSTCLTDICNVQRGTYYCHDGLDLNAVMNSPVYAVADGEIYGYGDLTTECSTWNGAYGKWLAVKHRSGTQEIVSSYSHLNSVVVTSGQVTQGQIIAYSGNTGSSTGPHLHFGLHINFAPACLYQGIPLDPQKWLPAVSWCPGFSNTPSCSVCQ